MYLIQLSIRRIIRTIRNFNSVLTRSSSSMDSQSSDHLEANNKVEHVGNILSKIFQGFAKQDHAYQPGRIVEKDLLEKFMNGYQSLSREKHEKKDLILYLCNNYGYDQSGIFEHCKALLNIASSQRELSTLLQTELRLKHSLLPSYCRIFTALGCVEHGVKFLIDMRHDVVQEIKNTKGKDENTDLIHFSEQLRELLITWFSVGMLKLQQITWNTPATIIEKIAKYEAVHQVRSWIDVKHRLGSYRRCYAFFHGSMPNEPVVILHVALTEKISDNIRNILKYNPSSSSPSIDEQPCSAECAIFYSITSTQPGLQGVELGAYMVQAVVHQLRHELPHLTKFSSLSPVPGFRKWLMNALCQNTIEILRRQDISSIEAAMKYENTACNDMVSFLKEVLTTGRYTDNPTVASFLKEPMLRLCAYYLGHAKRRGNAFDSTANFHLKNGAVIWRINWLADTSPSGIRQSFGMMVNYRYYLSGMSFNSINYVTNKAIPVSESIRSLFYDTEQQFSFIPKSQL